MKVEPDVRVELTGAGSQKQCPVTEQICHDVSGGGDNVGFNLGYVQVNCGIEIKYDCHSPGKTHN